MRNMLPGEVLRRLQINKCDVIVGGRSLRAGTMASVGPEVSVWALSTPSSSYFHTVFRVFKMMFRSGSQKHPQKMANYRCRYVFLS